MLMSLFISYLSPKHECENNIEYTYSLESPPCLHINFAPVPDLLWSFMICWQHYTATFVGIREPMGTFHVIPVVCLNTSPLSLKAVKTNRCRRQNVAFAYNSH